jgi:hypothetical protein
MLQLYDVLATWLGSLESRPTTPPRRALFLGAGFTKSCWQGAPLFEDLKLPLRQQLEDHSGLEPAVWNLARSDQPESVDPSELVELAERTLGRVAVVRAALAEPGVLGFRLYPPRDPVRRRPPLRAQSAFRTLREWRRSLDRHHPTHLDPLRPDSPAVFLGRLVAEGVVDTLLSTNWDAYAELGCLLAGVRVGDGAEIAGRREPWLEQLPTRLWIYETPQEAALKPRPQTAALLLKLHGGVRTLQGILHDLERGRILPGEAERQLSRSFLVTTEDLVRWRELVRWVRDATGDSLRSHSLLTLGISGADPVIYDAFRRRVREWEQERETLAQGEDPGSPPLSAADKEPKLRLINMLTVQQSDGPAHRVVRAGSDVVLKGAYGLWLLQQLLTGLSPDDALEGRLRAVLCRRLAADIARLGRDLSESEPTPLLDLLCHALGPGTRWAAIAERRPPFGGDTTAVAAAPFRRWWYAPWGFERHPVVRGSGAVDRLRQLAALTALIAALPGNGADHQPEIEPWTGVVHLPAGHWLSAHCRFETRAASLLLMPCPWRARNGLANESVRLELSRRFAWGPGRSLDHLARAPLWLVPVPGVRGERFDRLRVAGVEARVLKPERLSFADGGRVPKSWMEVLRWKMELS